MKKIITIFIILIYLITQQSTCLIASDLTNVRVAERRRLAESEPNYDSVVGCCIAPQSYFCGDEVPQVDNDQDGSIEQKRRLSITGLFLVLTSFLTSGFIIKTFLYTTATHLGIAVVTAMVLVGIALLFYRKMAGKKFGVWHGTGILCAVIAILFLGIYGLEQRYFKRDAHDLAHAAYNVIVPQVEDVFLEEGGNAFIPTGHNGVRYARVTTKARFKDGSLKDAGKLNAAQIDLSANNLYGVEVSGSGGLSQQVRLLNGVAAINGGYGKVAVNGLLGWLVINGKELQTYTDKTDLGGAGVGGYYEAILVIENDGKVRIVYANKDSWNYYRHRIKDTQFVLQNGPMLLYKGKVTKRVKTNSKDQMGLPQAAIGVDKRGKVYFFTHRQYSFAGKATLTGIRMEQFAELILDYCERNDISINNVISMDYGGYAQLYVAPGKDYPGHTLPADTSTTNIIVVPRGTKVPKRLLRNEPLRRLLEDKPERPERPLLKQEKMATKSHPGIKFNFSTKNGRNFPNGIMQGINNGLSAIKAKHADWYSRIYGIDIEVRDGITSNRPVVDFKIIWDVQTLGASGKIVTRFLSVRGGLYFEGEYGSSDLAEEIYRHCHHGETIYNLKMYKRYKERGQLYDMPDQRRARNIDGSS